MIAASRSEDGRLIERSAVCTHVGCIVQWNRLEQCWDCPCHGSQFTPEAQADRQVAQDESGQAPSKWAQTASIAKSTAMVVGKTAGPMILTAGIGMAMEAMKAK